VKEFERQFGEMSANLAASTKRGLPMIATGFIFWLLAGLAGFLDHDITVWVYLYGIGLIFPAGLGVARLMKAEMFVQGNPLASLAGVIGGMQVLFAPLIVYMLFHVPDWIPPAVGVLTGAHFLPFMLIYRSRAYGFLSIATVASAALIGFAAPESVFLATPFVLMGVYGITCLLLLGEWKKDR